MNWFCVASLMTEHEQNKTVGERCEARYANYFEIGHNDTEVVLVFGQFHSSQDHPLMHTRIITHPQGARNLLLTLQGALDRSLQPVAAGDSGGEAL